MLDRCWEPPSKPDTDFAGLKVADEQDEMGKNSNIVEPVLPQSAQLGPLGIDFHVTDTDSLP